MNSTLFSLLLLCPTESPNVEFICNVLVVADQLLITRLKEMCEVAITENCRLSYFSSVLSTCVTSLLPFSTLWLFYKAFSDRVASFDQFHLLFKLLAFHFAVTLKNAAELLEFAAMYNADQLKLSCLQFIVLNMAALLESK